MKSFTSNPVKTIVMGFAVIGIATLLPVFALMHVTALLCDQNADSIETQEKPTGPETVAKRMPQYTVVA